MDVFQNDPKVLDEVRQIVALAVGGDWSAALRRHEASVLRLVSDNADALLARFADAPPPEPEEESIGIGGGRTRVSLKPSKVLAVVGALLRWRKR